MRKIIVEARLLSRSTGISGFFNPLLQKLIKTNPNTEFILTTQSDKILERYKKYSNVNITNITSPKWIKHPYLVDLYYGIISFPNFLKNQTADLLISPYYDFLIPRKFHDKVIITVHDLCYYECNNLYKTHTKIPANYFLTKALNRCAGVLTVSETSYKNIKLYFPEITRKKHVIVTYNCFSKPNSKFKQIKLPQEIISKPGKKILYSGGFENRKNLSRLFRAFYQISQEYEDLYMIITGNLKNNKKFHRLIHSCGINEKILLPGNITDEQMQTLYQSGITGAVNLSLCEGFGRNSYEALLNGLPLLCSDIEINREIVGDYPIYCDPTNVEDIINGLKKLMKTTANKSLSSIDERFTIDYNFSNFSNLIDDCMK